MATASADQLLSPFRVQVEGIHEAAEAEERRVGAGSFGYVFPVTVGGVQRIAKKLHSSFVDPQVSDRQRESITSKFRDECVILSKLRHPNIVQFIGVHYGRRGKADLTLIMECVSSDMDKFLDPEVHLNIPLPLKLTILLDVSYGLVYLHERNPPIVHRDLTARNILITDKCKAKIADLGVAKVVDINTQMATTHTQTPGQMYYMPPEALTEKASCTPKLDIFSFGHLTLYTVNQEFPHVYDVSQTVTRAMQKRGDVERAKRQRAIDQVGRDHCLYRIIMDCLHDNPEKRPTIRAINSGLIDLSRQNPCPSHGEMLRISQLEGTIDIARAEAETYKADFQIERRDREKAQGALEELRAENERLGTENSEIKQKFEKLKTKIRDKLCTELDDRQNAISGLQEHIERLVHERNDLKHELELKDDQIKALIHHDQFLRARKEEQETAKKKMAVNRTCSAPQRGPISELSKTSSEMLSKETRDRIEALLFENEGLKRVVATLKREQGEAAAPSPEAREDDTSKDNTCLNDVLLLTEAKLPATQVQVKVGTHGSFWKEEKNTHQKTTATATSQPESASKLEDSL